MEPGENELEKRQYLRAIFDAVPLPTFVVDADVRIQDYNAAAAQLLGPEPQLAINRRGGEVLHCIHSEPRGCGRSAVCQSCVIRNSVTRVFAGGRTHREMHKAELRTQGQTTFIDLLVTAAPFPDRAAQRALLILEDITEILQLRGLIPICGFCKKVRDDQQYWQSIDRYLQTHTNMKLSHGLCPSCFAEQKKAIEACSERHDPKPGESPQHSR